jgi:biopolymer transport protein ExbD
MGRAKLPRKSTNIDMTAMCDVAFLLLSFFILATKQKPPEAVTVQAPSSVSSTTATEKSVMTTLTKDGKVFLMIGDEARKKPILDAVNASKSLGLSDGEIKKLMKLPFIGVPLGSLKILANRAEMPNPATLPGIPVEDSTKNELVDWYAATILAYDRNIDKIQENLLFKGDNLAKYPNYKHVKFALKKNALYKFRIVTNSETTPKTSEKYTNDKNGVDEMGEPLKKN